MLWKFRLVCEFAFSDNWRLTCAVIMAFPISNLHMCEVFPKRPARPKLLPMLDVG